MKFTIIFHLATFLSVITYKSKDDQMNNNCENFVFSLKFVTIYCNSIVKRVQLNFENSSYNVSSVVFMYSVC